MEGISNEVCSLAGHWGLGKLIALYDDNRISIDGHTEISFTEDVAARFEALGWHVQHVKDGNTDLKSLREAIETAKSVTDKPSFIKARARRRACTAGGCLVVANAAGRFPCVCRMDEPPAPCPAGGRQAGRHALCASAAHNSAMHLHASAHSHRPGIMHASGGSSRACRRRTRAEQPHRRRPHDPVRAGARRRASAAPAGAAWAAAAQAARAARRRLPAPAQNRAGRAHTPDPNPLP
jgi:hypothetical protein